MNSYPSQFQIQKYISKRNLILAASALVSAYGIWKLYQHKKGLYKKALHKVTIDSPSMPKCLSAITQEESTKWLACLSNVRYDILLSLFHKPTFQGKCTVTFDLSHIPDDLFLLFQGKEILSFRVNGKDLIPDHEALIQGQRLYIPSEYLKLTTNAVHIDYVANYHNDGSGLLLQVDYDGLPYVYSNCEPFSSQAIFPCFNTMGLRSTFTLQVTCPQDWIAVSNESVKYTSKTDRESTFGFFETQPIMCYIFVIACGPFCKIDAPKIYRGIQSSFYCKQSLSKHLEEQKEEIANLVCHGLDFFESFFGVSYPFSKHDMIFCPEFLTIAMECPGAITFCDEEFLFRDKPSYSQRVRRAYITLHEMAHMWFGNIVNIVWYDEIWLKESFASFFGYFALTHPELQSLFPGAWDDIELYKEHGIKWDNFKTLRHPLARGSLTNSHGAEFNYDDINYCKGSGIWKALWAQLGQETFKQVIQDYVNTNAWNTVTRTNFYTSLRKETHGSNFKAEEFIKNWLETEGTDSVQAHLEEVNGKIEEVKITICRDPPNSERIHLLKFALIYLGQSVKVQTITLNGDTNDLKINIDKDKDLKAVICNYDGLDLVKVRLDRRTIDYFLSNLAEIRQTDPNLETHFWRQLTLMVHNHDFPGEEFLDIVKTQFDNDLSGIMQIHSELLSRSEEFLDSSQAQKLKTYIADKALEMLRVSNTDDDEHKYLEQLIENAQSVKHFEKALPIINENLGTKGTEISTWINLGTGLIKNLLKTEFFERLASLIEQFFLASKGHCYEETYRLAAVYRLLRPYIENEIMDPAHFLESLITEEFISLKPREKRLFWSIVRHKYSKIFASQEYKTVYFDKLPSLYQKFYRLDAYAIIDNLFPEFDGDLQESIDYLQGCADKVKDQEIVLFFIHENLDKLKHKCCHKPL